MRLNEFKKSVRLLEIHAAAKWRAAFTHAFVNESSPYYKKHIGHLNLCSDGMFYEGYLWDCIDNLQPVTFDDFNRRLKERNGSVMVMWDLHSHDKIHIPDYWKFEKSAVLSVDTFILAEGLAHLPEDLYIFDESLSWTLVATHEYRQDDSRICAIACRNLKATS